MAEGKRSETDDDVAAAAAAAGGTGDDGKAPSKDERKERRKSAKPEVVNFKTLLEKEEASGGNADSPSGGSGIKKSATTLAQARSRTASRDLLRSNAPAAATENTGNSMHSVACFVFLFTFALDFV